ncbi:MAG: hypothetical protein IPQ06_08810 [Chitinophagaceae bacterium]|nr:hypothetical protein [Chitinophagaceae bacterium]
MKKVSLFFAGLLMTLSILAQHGKSAVKITVYGNKTCKYPLMKKSIRSFKASFRVIKPPWISVILKLGIMPCWLPDQTRTAGEQKKFLRCLVSGADMIFISK